MDECTILFLSVLRAVHVILGMEKEDIDDELMEQFTLAVYAVSGKSLTDPNQTISKKDFCSWISSWLEDCEPSLSNLADRFTADALITPEQRAAFEKQAKEDAEWAEEQARKKKEEELRLRLEAEEKVS